MRSFRFDVTHMPSSRNPRTPCRDTAAPTATALRCPQAIQASFSSATTARSVDTSDEPRWGRWYDALSLGVDVVEYVLSFQTFWRFKAEHGSQRELSHALPLPSEHESMFWGRIAGLTGLDMSRTSSTCSQARRMPSPRARLRRQRTRR